MPAAPTARFGKKTNDAPQAGAARGFHPLQWMRRFFTKPLKVKRIGMQLHVVFDHTRMQQETSSKPVSRGETLRLGHLALQNLLAQHQDTRHVVPHLSALEHALSRTGSRALTTLPPKVLQRAMDQLDLIEGNQRCEELMALRLRVEEIVRQRTPVNLRGDIANIEVRDASHSQYDEVESHWTGRVPLDEAPQPQAEAVK